MASLLLIHADRHAAVPVIAQLRALGFRVAHELTAAEGIDHAFAHRPDVIVLDANLGAGLSGRETGAAIHRAFDVPIVYLEVASDAGRQSLTVAVSALALST